MTCCLNGKTANCLASSANICIFFNLQMLNAALFDSVINLPSPKREHRKPKFSICDLRPDKFKRVCYFATPLRKVLLPLIS